VAPDRAHPTLSFRPPPPPPHPSSNKHALEHQRLSRESIGSSYASNTTQHNNPRKSSGSGTVGRTSQTGGTKAGSRRESFTQLFHSNTSIHPMSEDELRAGATAAGAGAAGAGAAVAGLLSRNGPGPPTFGRWAGGEETSLKDLARRRLSHTELQAAPAKPAAGAQRPGQQQQQLTKPTAPVLSKSQPPSADDLSKSQVEVRRRVSTPGKMPGAANTGIARPSPAQAAAATAAAAASAAHMRGAL
jgi:hypothetical protein